MEKELKPTEKEKIDFAFEQIEKINKRIDNLKDILYNYLALGNDFTLASMKTSLKEI